MIVRFFKLDRHQRQQALDIFERDGLAPYQIAGYKYPAEESIESALVSSRTQLVTGVILFHEVELPRRFCVAD